MTFVDLQPAMIVALVVIVALVAWRRAIKAPPRWLPLTVGLLQAGIVGGMAFAYFGLRDIDHAVASETAGNKTTALATGISSALWGVVAAAACALLAVMVLAIVTFRSRGVGRDELPVATVRDDSSPAI